MGPIPSGTPHSVNDPTGWKLWQSLPCPNELSGRSHCPWHRFSHPHTFPHPSYDLFCLQPARKNTPANTNVNEINAEMYFMRAIWQRTQKVSDGSRPPVTFACHSERICRLYSHEPVLECSTFHESSNHGAYQKNARGVIHVFHLASSASSEEGGKTVARKSLGSFNAASF